jgi:hypothetical protein
MNDDRHKESFPSNNVEFLFLAEAENVLQCLPKATNEGEKEKKRSFQE